MRILFKHANPENGHESTLFEFLDGDESYRYLFDVGSGVQNTLSDAELQSLDGIFITHAHADHYHDLPAILTQTDAPVYLPADSAAAIIAAVDNATARHELGDLSGLTDRIQTVSHASSTALTESLHVVALPAGHCPGACAYYLRVDDAADGGECPTILVTGDYTRRPAAATPGLALPASLSPPDILAVNLISSDGWEDETTAALGETCEAAFNQEQTLVAAHSLSGVHFAWLLDRLAQHLERPLDITLAGQTAVLWNALEYESAIVETTVTFDDPAAVIENTTVAIASPQKPTDGAAGALFDHIRDHSNAALVQLLGSQSQAISRARCRLASVVWNTHPPKETHYRLLEEWNPKHAIGKHIESERAKAIVESKDGIVGWGNYDSNAHLLYTDGEWYAPHWVEPDIFEQNTAGRLAGVLGEDERTHLSDALSSADKAGPLEVDESGGEVGLGAEGIALQQLRERFTIDAAAARYDVPDEVTVHPTHCQPAQVGQQGDSFTLRLNKSEIPGALQRLLRNRDQVDICVLDEDT